MNLRSKRWTKLLTASSLSVVLLTTPMMASANDSELSDVNVSNTGVMLNDPSLTTSKDNELEALAKEKDAWLEESLKEDIELNTLTDREYYSIALSNYAQENGYYCGPASARQALSFHKSKSGSGTALPSQGTLASIIGTTRSGSTTTGIAKGLNVYKATFGFSGNPYMIADVTNVTNPQATFETRVKGVLINRTNDPVFDPIKIFNKIWWSSY